MSGEGATGPAFDAAGNELRIGPARGSTALYNPANIKVRDVAEMTHEGDIIQFKMWLRHLSLLLSSAGMDVVLYAEVYDHASDKHRDALAFIDPSNRPAYFVALHKAVRARVYSALLKSENALLQSFGYGLTSP